MLFFQHGDFRPAGGGFGELAGEEPPDDELPALDSFGVPGGFAIEFVRTADVAEPMTARHSTGMASIGRKRFF